MARVRMEKFSGDRTDIFEEHQLSIFAEMKGSVGKEGW